VGPIVTPCAIDAIIGVAPIQVIYPQENLSGKFKLGARRATKTKKAPWLDQGASIRLQQAS
jgi:hypothetical protein